MSITEYKDVPYGPYERNVLDAYIVDSKEPVPALIYFHGGGYIEGDKTEMSTNPLKDELLEAGISVITCNYRFITNDPFPAPMEDGTRAIQFVKSKASEWGINPTKIASAGSSAGGHLALWNALKGELAKPGTSDPIERISSKVTAFIGFATQVSKDQRFYETIYDGPYIQPNLSLFYGVSTIEDLYQPKTLKLAEEASAINFMSSDAPPAFMEYYYDFDKPRIPRDADVGEVIHHPIHGFTLKRKYDALQIPFIFRHQGNPARPGEIVQFLNECFNNR